jgi:transcriptional regulator with XRE-family HTH domain
LSDVYAAVGKRIRELRMSFGGKGISQADLGRSINTPANTISRWETGTYKPSISDLEVLAHFFGVPVAHMLPQPELPPQMSALLSAMDGLDAADIQELIRYALFKRATAASNSREARST